MKYNKEIILACGAAIKELDAIRDYTEKIDATENEDMKKVYENNRMDELPHIQNLVVAITSMLEDKEPKTATEME